MSDRILSRDEDRWSVTEVGTLAMMIVIILVTIAGNIMVVMSVFTYKPLRNVQNFYIVSLACTDLMLATVVMPFHVTYWLVGRWTLGHLFCNVWATCDVLMCTASILNLCAIAVDRYYAIHDPIRYAQKRTMKRVLVSIFVVWGVSALISMPPLVGWFGGDSPEEVGQPSDLPLNDLRQKLKTSKKTSADEASNISTHHHLLHKSGIISGVWSDTTTTATTVDGNIDLDLLLSISSSPFSFPTATIPSKLPIKPRSSHRKSLYNSQDLSCELSANPIYVVYSAAGSFYIPLLIMFLLYVNIYLATKARLRKRTKLGKRLLMSVAPQKSSLSKKSFPENLSKFGQNGNASNEQTDGGKDRPDENSENKKRTSESKTLSFQNVGTSQRSTTNILLTDLAEVRTEKENKNDEDSLTSLSSPSAQIENHQKAALNSDFHPQESRKTFPVADDLRRDHNPNENKTESTDNFPSATRVKRPTTLAANNVRGGTGTLRKFLEEKQRISLSLERRAARTMGIIMGAFVICWLPFFVCYVVMPFCPSCSQSIDQSFVSFFVWLGYINSAINPFIYTIFNIDYRRAFRNILQGMCLSS